MPMREAEPVPRDLADAEVLDHDGQPTRLGDYWRQRPAVLFFLRHFACVACTEYVASIAPRLIELRRLGLGVVFVGNGAPNFIDGFMERNGLDTSETDVVTDPTLKAFEAAGMTRSVFSTYGPRAVANYARAWLHGFVQTSIEGDTLQQGGVIVIDREGKVAYIHRDRVLGDHAPPNDVVDAALRVAATKAALV